MKFGLFFPTLFFLTIFDTPANLCNRNRARVGSILFFDGCIFTSGFLFECGPRWNHFKLFPFLCLLFGLGLSGTVVARFLHQAFIVR